MRRKPYRLSLRQASEAEVFYRRRSKAADNRPVRGEKSTVKAWPLLSYTIERLRWEIQDGVFVRRGGVVMREL